jgi:Mg2+ and Co2+ transporter CorA
MDFDTAKEIARSHPGATLKRKGPEGFQVVAKGGVILKPPLTEVDAQFAKNSELARTVGQLRRALAGRQAVFKRLLTERELREREARERYAELQASSAAAREALSELQTKVAEMDEDDWALIDSRIAMRKREKASAIIQAARLGSMSYIQLRGILDNLHRFEFGEEEIKILNVALAEQPPPWPKY